LTMASSRVARAAAAAAPIVEFLDSPLARRAEDPRAANFLFGNPQELPLSGFGETLRRWAVPQHKDWFAYTTYQRPAQEAVARSLHDRYGIPFAPEDIALTTGVFGGLSLLLTLLVDEGDEVIFSSPPWFFYESMILLAGGVPVKTQLEPPTFDLDPARIERAITSRTRAVIVNSAHNPTGRVYSEATLRALAAVLQKAGERHGHPIFLLSDEAYSHLVFNGRQFVTPTAFHPHSFLMYTYGKVLLTPGQRLGYVALPPAMPDRERWRQLLLTTQVMLGWTFPNALMQFSLPELDAQSIDVADLQRKRDRLVPALRQMGYDVASPESTFYLLPRSPIPDDREFCVRLAAHSVLCMPGSLFDAPGYFRISITASDAMIDRGLEGFARAHAR